MKITLAVLSLLILAVASLTPGCSREVCDHERRERLIMECLDRMPKSVSVGEDVNLGSAVWPCRQMANELSCWYEKDKPWWRQ